jgi:hypothetical protein
MGDVGEVNWWVAMAWATLTVLGICVFAVVVPLIAARGPWHFIAAIGTCCVLLIFLIASQLVAL